MIRKIPEYFWNCSGQMTCRRRTVLADDKLPGTPLRKADYERRFKESPTNLPGRRQAAPPINGSRTLSKPVRATSRFGNGWQICSNPMRKSGVSSMQPPAVTERD